jgi:hypothetical protein
MTKENSPNCGDRRRKKRVIYYRFLVILDVSSGGGAFQGILEEMRRMNKGGVSGILNELILPKGA